MQKAFVYSLVALIIFAFVFSYGAWQPLPRLRAAVTETTQPNDPTSTVAARVRKLPQPVSWTLLLSGEDRIWMWEECGVSDLKDDGLRIWMTGDDGKRYIVKIPQAGSPIEKNWEEGSTDYVASRCSDAFWSLPDEVRRKSYGAYIPRPEEGHIVPLSDEKGGVRM